MKAVVKRIVDRAVSIDWLWGLIDASVIPIAAYLSVSRRRLYKKRNQEQSSKIVQLVFPSKTVLHGAFAGMKYPEMVSVGSTLFPKLLGSYEREIQPVIEKICRKPYTEIVDIGCAEGYYAVGLAMRIQGVPIFAFDTDPVALEQCRKMAHLNGVSERLTTASLCCPSTLVSLPLTKRALIVCDCEGYEKQLFNPDILPALSRHELLIEAHDFLDIEISQYLLDLFKTTHEITIYRSIDDNAKVRNYKYPELEGLPLAMKLEILREGRPVIMEWLYLVPKESA